MPQGSVQPRFPEFNPGKGAQGAPDVLVLAASDPQWNEAYGLDLVELGRRAGASDSAGSVTVLTLPEFDRLTTSRLARSVVLFGLGARSEPDLRRSGAAAVRAVSNVAQRTAGSESGSVDAECVAVAVTGLSGVESEGVRGFITGFGLGAYRHPRFGTSAHGAESTKQPQLSVNLHDVNDAEVIAVATQSARATWLARTWAATPSNMKSPQWLADEVRREATGLPVTVTVRDADWLAEQGFGGTIAVGQGSPTPPRLIVIEYRGNDRPPIALVGKGITFDTGGLALKPRDNMVQMKTDMSGAAAVLSAVLQAAAAGLKTSAVAVVPAAENALGGGSYRPGDVLTVFDGTTVEIGNTDAEGRLVLADALGWVQHAYAPEALIDIATLTGAATLGLGKTHAALYSNDQVLGQQMLLASDHAGEPMWQLPLVQEYRPALESEVADLSHIATDSKVGAGSITAALFLEHFVGDIPWVHLDIAGTGRSAVDREDKVKGATGFGARALWEFLRRRSQ